MTDINKSFPGVHAIKSVNLEIKKGEVHALVGENGAGKSTLMKILTGVLMPDSGYIEFENKKHNCFGITESKELGIGMIYQELNLISKLNVAENIYIGNEPKKGIFIDKQLMIQNTLEILRKMEIDIEPKTLVGSLSIAYQQIIEIAKAISKQLKVLIMDEPTAPLTNDEVKILFELINKLKEQGISIIYISHRIEEIFQICDTVTVMRDGAHITTMPTSQTNKEKLIKEMVGRELNNLCPRIEVESGETVLQIKNLINERVKNVSFEIKKGEILGLGGLVGAGRSEVLRALFGADKFYSGKIIGKMGKELKIGSPSDAIKNGIVLIPEDRKQQGLLISMSIKDNMIMPNMDIFSSGAIINNKKVKTLTNEYIKKLSVKTPSLDQIINFLSGGNQQKVVIAKWLLRDAEVILFDEPTRGIDVGAKYEIYMLMNELKKQGKAIVMVSSEMEELIGMSDRIVVMCEGKVTGELDKNEIDQERILWLASRNTNEKLS